MADCGATSSDAAAWRAALAADPCDTAAMHGLAMALVGERRWAEAVALLSLAAELSAGAAVLSDLGSALAESGQAPEAEVRLRQALEAEPGFYPALCNLGALLLSSGRSAEAEAAARAARAADAERPEAQALLAKALLTLGNEAQAAGDSRGAEALYRAAAAEQPSFAAAHYNLGVALVAQLRTEEGLAAFRHALALEPEDDTTAFSLGLGLLMAGEEQEGLRLQERRRGAPAMRPNFARRPGLRLWEAGESLAGKRVLVLAEQGAGDLIQHARFVPGLAEVAAGVALEVPWLMTELFRDLPGVRQLLTLADLDPEVDVAVPMLSLQLAGMRPVAVPYLQASADRRGRWAAWLDRGPEGRRIGLVCSGDARHGRDRERSVPLARFAPLLAVPGAAFVLVQPDIRESDLAAFEAAEGLRCPAAALTDYADTAALLAELDLVVSVDTSTAHLAGALGVPAWTLVSFCPDYRWGLGREDTPWYPSMRLFRQERAGDWDAVIDRVRNELARG